MMEQISVLWMTRVKPTPESCVAGTSSAVEVSGFLVSQYPGIE